MSVQIFGTDWTCSLCRNMIDS